jgi:dolichyl-phosphate-mannose--protein O-mannosyl transferase
MNSNEDPNSLWTLRRAYRASAESPTSTYPLSAGTPIQCGSIIRLQHVLTKRYLHSHQHHSPLTQRQEISGYGDANASDSGDDWKVECVGAKTGDFWKKENGFYISLVHVDTNRRLFTRRADMFTQNNCPNCPIVNQLEISGHTASIGDENTHFSIGNIGGFIPSRETKASSS